MPADGIDMLGLVQQQQPLPDHQDQAEHQLQQVPAGHRGESEKGIGLMVPLTFDSVQRRSFPRPHESESSLGSSENSREPLSRHQAPAIFRFCWCSHSLPAMESEAKAGNPR